MCSCCPSLLVVKRRGDGERPKGGCIKGGWGETERELGFVAEVEVTSCCASWSLFNLNSKRAGSAGDEIYVVCCSANMGGEWGKTYGSCSGMRSMNMRNITS